MSAASQPLDRELAAGARGKVEMPRIHFMIAGALLVSLAAATAFTVPIDLSLPPVFSALPVLVDVDGDGLEDAVEIVYDDEVDEVYAIAVRRNLGDGTLAPAQHYDANGTHPIAGEDLDGDGHLDLVVKRDGGTWAVGMLMNAGDGTFLPVRTRSVSNQVKSIVTADLDADGHRELVAATYRNSSPQGAVIVVPTLAGGDLGTAVTYELGSADPGALAVGDFDGNGSPDIAMSLPGSYMPNIGSGAFGPPIGFGSGSNGKWIFAANLGGTPATDVLLVNATRTIVLRSVSSGFMASTYDIGSSVEPLWKDLDGDGRGDLALADEATCNVLFGDVTGSFTRRNYSVSTGPYVGGIVAADIDRDGRLDVAVTGGRTLVPLWGLGGTFRVGDALGNLPPYWRAASSDTDGDGFVDLNVGMTAHGFETATSDAPMTVALPRYLIGAEGAALASLDLNGDDQLDFVTESSTFLSLGNGRFARSYYIPVIGDGIARQILGADLDAQGHPDLVMAKSGGSAGGVAVFLATIQFHQGTLYAGGTAPTAVASGDFDGDGDQDLVSNGWGNSIVLLRNDGAGAFGSPTYLDFAAPSPGGLAVADFDADGDPDIAADGGALKLLPNQGGASFAAPVTVASGCNGKLHVADVDRDGRPDLVKKCLSVIVVHRNLGDGAFASETVTFPPGTSQSLAVADLDGDGIPDLVVFFTDTFGRKHARLLAGRGDGTFEAAADREVWDDGFDSVVGEFTGDLRPDLLTPGFLYPNRTTFISPIAVEDFGAFHTAEGVRLQWRLAGDVERDLAGVYVQRSEAGAGPYVELHSSRLPPDGSGEYLDVEAPVDVTSWYRLVLERRDGTRVVAATLSVSAGHASAGPLRFDLLQRNPDGHVEMRYSLPNRTLVSFAIHDVKGRCLWDTEPRPEESGAHVRTWDGRSRDGRHVGRGVYMVSLRAGAAGAVRKLVLWRD